MGGVGRGEWMGACGMCFSLPPRTPSFFEGTEGFERRGVGGVKAGSRGWGVAGLVDGGAG